MSDDSARANMGGKWQMPTKADFEEFNGNALVSSVKVGTVQCVKVTNKNDSNKYILFPIAGYCSNGSIGRTAKLC